MLLDTVGYNQAGPDADQFDDTVEAAREADLIFFVTHARNPGRDADVKLWHDLKDYFTDRPELKMPPALVVMTHIDLLSPSMEWAPPYDWHNPKRPKEKNIAEAAQVVEEQFGGGFMSIVPVCSAEGKAWGIKEELMPEIVELLGEARGFFYPLSRGRSGRRKNSNGDGPTARGWQSASRIVATLKRRLRQVRWNHRGKARGFLS